MNDNLKELKDQAVRAWNKLLDIRSKVGDDNFRPNEVIAKLVMISPKLANSNPVIIRHMVESKLFYPDAVKYYLLWVSKQDVSKIAQESANKEWPKLEKEKLEKVLLNTYNNPETIKELYETLDYLEDVYGLTSGKIPESELPKEIAADLERAKENYYDNILIETQAELEAKYYVYVLDEQEKKHHQRAPDGAKIELLKSMTKIITDEKKRNKEVQDARVEKEEKRTQEMRKEGRKEAIEQMKKIISNHTDSNPGVTEVLVQDLDTWKMMMELNI